MSLSFMLHALEADGDPYCTRRARRPAHAASSDRSLCAARSEDQKNTQKNNKKNFLRPVLTQTQRWRRLPAGQLC